MAAQPKHTIPKDASVIMSIMKDMGILEYESRVVNQLLEFTYRYVTCILDDSRVYANHAKKKGLDLEDTKLAISLISERSFTTPPHRDLLLDIARTKNTLPLPLIKPHCGIRLPPDRYCLLSCNYRMLPKKQPQVVMSRGGMGYSAIGGKMIAGKGQVGQVAIVKRPGALTSISRTLPVTGSKPVIKFSTGMNVPKLITKPKIQVQAPIAVKIDSEPSNDLKRKRDDDSFEGEYLDHLKQRKINE